MSGLIGPGGHDGDTHLSFSSVKGPGRTARVCSRRGGPAGGIRVAAAARAAESHPCPWVEWPRGRCFEPAGLRPPAAHRLCLVPAAFTPGVGRRWSRAALPGTAWLRSQALPPAPHHPPAPHNPRGGISLAAHWPGEGSSLGEASGQEVAKLGLVLRSPECPKGQGAHRLLRARGPLWPGGTWAPPRCHLLPGKPRNAAGGGTGKMPTLASAVGPGAPIRRGLRVRQQKDQ